MIELKVHCDCGQKYKFDVEPVNGRMPFTVACPVCKADGTVRANALLQQMAVFKMVEPPPALTTASAPAPIAPVAPPAGPSRLRVNVAAPAASQAAAPDTPPPPAAIAPPPIQVRAAVAEPAPALATRPAGRTPGAQQPDRDQAEVEARAKILWGDAPDEVIHFLMLRGFTNEEASENIRAMLKERRRTIRAKGIVKTIGGILLTCGAAGFLVTMLKYGFFSPFVLGLDGLACVCGLWMILNGLWKIIAPGAQIGDASDND